MDETFVGVTDGGQPLVLADSTCPHWLPGKMPMLDSRTCWYCRYADFRKTTEVILFQSVCRCPHNRLAVLRGQENEHMEHEGGTKE